MANMKMYVPGETGMSRGVVSGSLVLWLRGIKRRGHGG